jgi:hypothetical protein
MLNQIFKKNVPIALLFELLEKISVKTDKYYLVDINAYKKMLYHHYYDDFCEQMMEYYHVSKQVYLTRKLTYNSFTNVIRQICKSNNVMFTSNIKYNKSLYNIQYLIYHIE